MMALTIFFVVIAPFLVVGTTDAESIKTTLSGLRDSGGEMVCKAEIKEAGSLRSAIAHIHGKQSRFEILTLLDNSPKKLSFMIQNETWLYLWGALFREGQGVKIKQESKDATGVIDVDTNEIMIFDCEAQPIDDAIFSPPDGILFQEL